MLLTVEKFVVKKHFKAINPLRSKFSLECLFLMWMYIHKKKFQWLLNEKEGNIDKYVPPITYHCYSNPLNGNLTFNISEEQTNNNQNLISRINLISTDFKHFKFDFSHILNDKWFINLSEKNRFAYRSFLFITVEW